MLRSPFAPPTRDEAERIGRLAQAIRCFDRNGATDCSLPTTDPHGHELAELTSEELRERASWCMLPEYHAALLIERRRRPLGQGCK